MAENFKQDTARNMPKYRVSLIRIFPHIDRIVSMYGYDTVHIRENADQRKPVFQHISCSERTGVVC